MKQPAMLCFVAVSALLLPCVVRAQSGGLPLSSDWVRARALVARMTLDEKITELHGVQTPEIARVVPGIRRLGIPALHITNGPAGVGHGGESPQLRATALPAPVALAASWDVDLARKYGVVAAQETRDIGSELLEAPDINIIREPQSGRAFESFTEDPYLNARLSVATIEGIQSVGIMANVKHYVANNQEQNRRAVNEVIDERTLREIYMPAFKASVTEANVASLMCAYPKVNGAFNCANAVLLRGVLKEEWGFKGFVISDYGAVHGTIDSALNGLDLEMPTGEYFSSDLKAAVLKGQVPIAVINEMLVRRFAMMMHFGLFGVHQLPRPIPVLLDGKTSRDIAEQSMVLLKNQSHLLPLDNHKLNSVALIGQDAMHAKTGGGGSSHVIPLYNIAPVDGIAAHMLLWKRVDLLDGFDLNAAVATAKADDIAIVMVGDDESEGHDHPIELSVADNTLIQRVAAANPKTIVVLKSGSAVLMPWLNSVAAVLEAWYPGEEDGNAIADLLFGDVNPSGKLPLTFPESVSDTLAKNPAYYPGDGDEIHYGEGLEVGYRWYQAHKVGPLFPFGFGLSYTTFSFSDLHVTSRVADRHSALIRFHLTNTGSRTGAEVGQVYIGFPDVPDGNEPPRQLAGFRKVILAPGQSSDVTISLSPRAFSYWSVKDHAWHVQKGSYSIMVGSSSVDLPLSASIVME